MPDGLKRSVLMVNYFAVIVFAVALAMVEEFTDLRKSKPMVLVAGLIWSAIAWLAVQNGTSHEAELALRQNLLQYVELMLLLLAAITYINAMSERRLFTFLRDWLAHQRASCRCYPISSIASLVSRSPTSAQACSRRIGKHTRHVHGAQHVPENVAATMAAGHIYDRHGRQTAC